MIYKPVHRSEWGGWRFCAVSGDQAVPLDDEAATTREGCRARMRHRLVTQAVFAHVPAPELDVRVRFGRRARLWIGQWWRPGLLGFTSEGAQVGRRWVPMKNPSYVALGRALEGRDPARLLEER